MRSPAASRSLPVPARGRRRSSLTSMTSSGRWTKDNAIQSMSSSSAAARSARSLSVIAEVGIVVSGRLTPFLLETLPATSTIVSARPDATSETRSSTLPSSISTRWPGAARRGFRDGEDGPAVASPSVGVGVEREHIALVQLDAAAIANSPTLSFGPCRSTRMAIGRSNSSSIERIIATRSRIASCEAWLMLMRKTSAPATNRLATTARSVEAGPSVAMILMRRLRRITSVLTFVCFFRAARGARDFGCLSRTRRVGCAGGCAQGLVGSVSWTVQFLASLPVSTSKKPVRS